MQEEILETLNKDKPSFYCSSFFHQFIQVIWNSNSLTTEKEKKFSSVYSDLG